MTMAVLGEALIDFIRGEDGAYRAHAGGSPYNVAIGLARQGVPVSYLSPLSDDHFGDQLAGNLAAEGVALPFPRRSRCPTSLALVTVDDAGTPTYRLYREGIADKDATADDVLAVLPEDVDLFHTGSLAITPSQLPKMRTLIGRLRERGVTISMDVNIRLRASLDTDAYLDGVRSLLPLADIVKASDEDLEPFGLASDAVGAARAAHALMGSGMLLLTEGRGGAVLIDGSGELRCAGYPIAQVADTVGAGDTFHAAFLAALQRAGGPAAAVSARDRLADALDHACAAAAINVSRVGCSPPATDEVEAFRAAARR